jgi:DNA-binding NtrC family response regulator
MLSTDTVRQHLNTLSLRAHRGSMTLLLVDDDPTVLALLKTVLMHEGYRVIAVASPILALELATRESFNMLITDLQMPEIDGFTLATHLTRNRVALPVLVISGAGSNEVPMSEIAERHWNFMSKPIDRERLLRIIDGECLGWALRMRA